MIKDWLTGRMWGILVLSTLTYFEINTCQIRLMLMQYPHVVAILFVTRVASVYQANGLFLGVFLLFQVLVQVQFLGPLTGKNVMGGVIFSCNSTAFSSSLVVSTFRFLKWHFYCCSKY